VVGGTHRRGDQIRIGSGLPRRTPTTTLDWTCAACTCSRPARTINIPRATSASDGPNPLNVIVGGGEAQPWSHPPELRRPTSSIEESCSPRRRSGARIGDLISHGNAPLTHVAQDPLLLRGQRLCGQVAWRLQATGAVLDTPASAAPLR